MKHSIVEVELPNQATSTTDEEALLQLMVTTLDQSVRSLRSQLVPRNNLAKHIPSTTYEAGQVRPDGLRGNVELLPPPPGSAPETSSQRYLELPAPPE